MASYTVHVPNDSADGFSRAARSAFVREGFSWPAFLFGPLYLLVHRAWIAAAAWVVGTLLVAAVFHVLHMPTVVDTAVALLIMLFTGFEASSLRRFALESRGYDLVDVAEGSREEAERDFFRRAMATGLPARRTRPMGSAIEGRAAAGGGVIGFDDLGPAA